MNNQFTNDIQKQQNVLDSNRENRISSKTPTGMDDLVKIIFFIFSI
jgi:hypothetical protein